jgi:tetratricopeptide (TPR) repeat protein
VHRWPGWLLVVVLCALCGAAQAQSLRGAVEEPEEDPRYRVYVVPRVEFLPDPDQAREAIPQLDTEQLVEAIEGYFSASDGRFRVIPSEALFARFDAPSGQGVEGVSALRFFLNVQQAETSLQSGIKSLSRFDLKDAERHLLRAASLYEEVQAQLLLPVELARVYEYLGLVYVEQGQRQEDAISAFIQMLRLDGRTVLGHPYYPAGTAALSREARRRLLISRGGGADDTDREEIVRTARLVDANIVIWGYTVQEGDKKTLHLQMYRQDGEGTGFPAPEVIELDADVQVSQERADRLASRFAACVEPLPTPLPPPPDRERGRFYLEPAFAYTLYLEPIDTLFNNFGFTLTGSYMLLENFGLVGRVSLLDGGNDSAESLIQSPLSARMFFGAGFAIRPTSWLRLFANFAAEGSFISQIQTTDSFFCKVDRGSSQCLESEISTQPSTWYLGLNAHMGARFRLYKDLFAVGSGGFSFYAWPLEGRAVNYPVSGNLGLGYRF